MPDDDWIEDEYAINKILKKIEIHKDDNMTMILTGLIARDLESLEPVDMPSVTSTLGDVFISNGRDVLTIVNEYDLIGVQRTIIRKDVLPHDFVDGVFREFVMPIAICFVACTKGSVLIMGEKLAAFGAGDDTAWRVRWSEIALQIIPDLLCESVSNLDFPQGPVDRRIQFRKGPEFDGLMPPGHLLFRHHGVSWRHLARYYGAFFVFRKILSAIPWYAACVFETHISKRFIKKAK
jgi:hypothetical protein